jgi:hypothetical protein
VDVEVDGTEAEVNVGAGCGVLHAVRTSTSRATPLTRMKALRSIMSSLLGLLTNCKPRPILRLCVLSSV